MSEELAVKQFIVTAFAPDITVDQLPNDLDLLDTGVVDSLGLLRLIAWVEDRYAIPLEDENLSPAHFSSVDAILALVDRAGSLV